MDEEDNMDPEFQDQQRPRHRTHGLGQRTQGGEIQIYPGSVDPDTLLAQFSFAPATQTTVVTTTTTTTTKFPPFLMRPPRRMQELDLKSYPLAAAPTPAHLKNIQFVIGGKQTIFREAEDTTLALEQVRFRSPNINEELLSG